MTRTSREQIRSAVGRVLFNASNYPAKAQRHMLGQDFTPLLAKVVDAVMAAGSVVQPAADSDEPTDEMVKAAITGWITSDGHSDPAHFDVTDATRDRMRGAIRAALAARPVPAAQPQIAVVHVAHDMEAHAASFNDGYGTAQRQGFGGTESRGWAIRTVMAIFEEADGTTQLVAEQVVDALLSEIDFNGPDFAVPALLAEPADAPRAALHEAAAQIEAYLLKEGAPPIWWRCYDIVHKIAGCTWVDTAGEDGLGEYDCRVRAALAAGGEAK